MNRHQELTEKTTVLYEKLPVNNVFIGSFLVLFSIVFLLAGLQLNFPSTLLLPIEVGITFAIYALVVLSLNLQFGYTDLVNFGPVAFVAVGAYTTALLTASNPYYGIGFGLPWYVGLLGGVVMAILLGLLIGASTLQLRGDYLAIVTLAAAEILHSLAGSVQSIFGGQFGITNVPQPIADLAANPKTQGGMTLVLFFGILFIFYGLFTRLSKAPYGRVLRAIRADKDVAEAVGKNAFKYKVQTFVYGGAVAGFAGGLMSLYNGSMSPGFVTIELTIIVWIGMLIGGAQNYRGVLGGLLLIMGFQLVTRFLNQAVPVTSTTFASFRLMLIGLLLVMVIRYRPEGIWGDPKKLGYK